ncbi:MAG: Tol biopolymer transporter periplasmic protein [Synechococcus sp. NAT40]|jgi:Tol biopolymer transport system component|nr:Tol biopolymer transporter periplasmic protein [Synechococcus sp. NAT40]RZO13669.1 MAG: Tol biopolymer transporter periplasmic protein [Synechococcus sp. MED-G135]|tara:strand:+ start:86 stop:640 length:555 start_codon:yes stop_codon:yes gene_type:complete
MRRLPPIARVAEYSLIAATVSLLMLGCSPNARRAPGASVDRQQQDPAISGNGNILAVIVEQRGRPTVELRDLRSGQRLPLRHLNRQQPHSSPSLSWNGRYLAVITQRGNRRMALVEDRVTGRAHPLRPPGNRDPVRVSLAPDGQRMAIQVADRGRWRVEMLDLSSVLEPDRPGGLRVTTPQEGP